MYTVLFVHYVFVRTRYRAHCRTHYVPLRPTTSHYVFVHALTVLEGVEHHIQAIVLRYHEYIHHDPEREECEECGDGHGIVA